MEDALINASLQVIRETHSSALNKIVTTSFQAFVRRLVINFCKDMIERKHMEAENIRLQLRKFEKEEQARKKRELEEGLKKVAAAQKKLEENQSIFKSS